MFIIKYILAFQTWEKAQGPQGRERRPQHWKITTLSLPCSPGLRLLLHLWRPFCSILFLKLPFFSSYSLQRITSSSLMMMFLFLFFPEPSWLLYPFPSLSSFLFIAVMAVQSQHIDVIQRPLPPWDIHTPWPHHQLPHAHCLSCLLISYFNLHSHCTILYPFSLSLLTLLLIS